MNWRDHLDRDPAVLAGKPKIKGTRIGVELILERLADGWTAEQLIESFPHLSVPQIRACLAYAAESIATDDVLDVPLSAA